MVRDTPTALVVVDVEGTVLVANPSARRLLTMARSGRSLTALMDDSDASRVHEYLESLFRGSSRSVHLERLRLRGKHDTWVSLDGRSVRFIAGFRGAVLAVQNITPWVEQVAELTVRSSTDALTGLRNRRVLDEEATRTHRECDGALFVVLDIDRFKEVNDGHGHAFGDGVLVQVGHRLKALASDSATVFRLGGDEFALLFPEGGEALAHDLVTRLQEINRQPFLVHGQNVAITFSAGVALRGGHSSHEWIARADAALYRAKGQPGAVVIWDEEFRDWRSRRLDLEAELPRIQA